MRSFYIDTVISKFSIKEHNWRMFGLEFVYIQISKNNEAVVDIDFRIKSLNEKK
jgi:hypothetical protein